MPCIKSKVNEARTFPFIRYEKPKKKLRNNPAGHFSLCKSFNFAIATELRIRALHNEDDSRFILTSKWLRDDFLSLLRYYQVRFPEMSFQVVLEKWKRWDINQLAWEFRNALIGRKVRYCPESELPVITCLVFLSPWKFPRIFWT